jgi:HEAT repeat protein
MNQFYQANTPRSILSFVSILLLNLAPVIGIVDVARSDISPRRIDSSATTIDRLTKLLQNSNPSIRSSAARDLGDIGVSAKSAKSAIPLLIPLLKDPYPNIRRGAVFAFGNMPESGKALIPQILLLLNDKDTDVVKETRSTLTKLGYHK